MMNAPTDEHPTDDDLHGLAEGTLSAERRGGVESHVAVCAGCSGSVNRIRSLLAGVAALPRSVDPDEDLWSGIEARIRRAAPDASIGGGAPSRPPSWSRHQIGWLAAAAVLLVVASSAITTLVVTRDDGPRIADRPAPAPRGADSGAPMVTVGSEYDRMERDLSAMLASQRKTLQPETVARVERNMAIIDQAIAEIRLALASDPTNRALHALLKASYGQKAALLEQASRT